MTGRAPFCLETLMISTPSHTIAPNGDLYTIPDKPGAHPQPSAPEPDACSNNYDHLRAYRSAPAENLYGPASGLAALAQTLGRPGQCRPQTQAEAPLHEPVGEPAQARSSSAGRGSGIYESIDAAEESRAEFMNSACFKEWQNPLNGSRGVPLRQFALDLAKVLGEEYPAGMARAIMPAHTFGAGKALHLAAQTAMLNKYDAMFTRLRNDSGEARKTFGVQSHVAQQEVLKHALKDVFDALPEEKRAKWIKRLTPENLEQCRDRLKLELRGNMTPNAATLTVLQSVTAG